MMRKVVAIAKCGKYSLENCGTFYAICEVSEDTPRHVYHTGSKRYILKKWNDYYRDVMYRDTVYGREMYFEK